MCDHAAHNSLSAYPDDASRAFMCIFVSSDESDDYRAVRSAIDQVRAKRRMKHARNVCFPSRYQLHRRELAAHEISPSASLGRYLRSSTSDKRKVRG